MLHGESLQAGKGGRHEPCSQVWCFQVEFCWKASADLAMGSYSTTGRGLTSYERQLLFSVEKYCWQRQSDL